MSRFRRLLESTDHPDPLIAWVASLAVAAGIGLFVAMWVVILVTLTMWSVWATFALVAASVLAAAEYVNRRTR